VHLHQRFYHANYAQSSFEPEKETAIGDVILASFVESNSNLLLYSSFSVRLLLG